MGGKKKKKQQHASSSGELPKQKQQEDGDQGGAKGGLDGGGGGGGGAAAAAMPTTSIMECEICKEKFDTEDRKPRNLQCGHSFCSDCCVKLEQHKAIKCPRCRLKTMLKESTEELPVNYLVLEMVGNFGSNDAAPSQMRESASWERADTSPHGGRCLEAQAKISEHCAFCHMWLCKDCSRIDHRRPQCVLMPYRDTLKEMHQVSITRVTSTANSLKEFSREAKSYSDKLRSFAAFMELALDCVKREHDHLVGLRDHGRKMEKEIWELSERCLPGDLEEALLFLDGTQDAANMTHKWICDASAFLKGEQVFKLSKRVLQTALKMHTASGGVMAVHSIKGVDTSLLVEMDRGRLLVHAPAAPHVVPEAGFRVLEFQHIKSCIDPSRSLTFLDINAGGQEVGRLFIRLLGCSKQSRCFLMMCTGETGTSYRNTRFHRLWWKNLPGEHMWGGDHDRGDGSGGAIPTEILKETKDLLEIENKMAITPGLVAGRYGKCNSTIFRVYTKFGDDAKEEAVFARVEYGFQALREALENHKSITDITISSCGVVVEP